MRRSFDPRSLGGVRTALAGCVLAGAGLLAACGGSPQENTMARNRPEAAPPAQTPPPESMPVLGRTAVATLQPTEGSDVHGTVTFTLVEGGVHVTAEVSGLTEGDHGFHIHEYGDCSAADGTSAGGHFNPDGTPHGAPMNPPSARHVGDLGNIHAGPDGKATYDRVDTELAFTGPHSILGRGLIVHEGADDLTTQPTGNAGARVACGVIGLAKGNGS